MGSQVVTATHGTIDDSKRHEIRRIIRALVPAPRETVGLLDAECRIGEAMELCDPGTLKQFFAPPREPRQRTVRVNPKSADALSVYEPPPHKSRSRRCQCGGCMKCVENARWERIFQERFADPEYYSRPRLRHDSSLGDW